MSTGKINSNTSGVVTVPNTTDTLTGKNTTDVFTNKSIDAATNTLTNITNSAISASAAIAYSKLNLSTSILNADINAAAAIAYSKLNLSGSILNADINSSAAIARTKLASGTASHVIINDGSGVLSSEATLAKTRGGTAQDNSSLTFPSSGTVPAFTPTNHGVVISGSGAAATVTSAGTSGQVLTSNGASADPTFQTIGTAQTEGGVVFGNSGGTGITTDSSNFFWNDSTNRLGIGTATPETTLDARGTIQCLNTIQSRSGNDLNVKADGTNRDIFFIANAATVMTVQGSTARVGIGTSSPAKDLVISASAPTFRVNSTFDGVATNDQVLGVIDFYTNDGSTDGTGIGASISHLSQDTLQSTAVGSALTFATRNSTGPNASERMRIDKDGKVGIGTASPASRLDITATNINVPAFGARYNSTNARMSINLANSNGFPYLAVNATPTSSSDTANFELSASTRASRLRMDNGIFQFDTSSAAGTAGNAITWNNSMYIDTSGKVGVGTASPSVKLHLYDSASNDVVERIEVSANNKAPTIQFKSPTVTNTIGQETTSGNAAFGGSTANALCLYSGSSSYDTILGTSTAILTAKASNSFVGIGTTSPAYNLHVKSTSSGIIGIESSSTSNECATRFYDTAGTLRWSIGTAIFDTASGFAIASGSGQTTRFNVTSGGAITLGTSGGGQTHTLHTGTTATGTAALTIANGPGSGTRAAVGYITINVNGTDRVIPFFATS